MKQLTDHIALRNSIFNISPETFEAVALQVFQFQFQNNPFYRRYCNTLHPGLSTINKLSQIPFMPIQFFKTQEIKTGSFDAAVVFESSGTTGTVNSRHYIKDIGMYEESFSKAFRLFYGAAEKYCILGLLPSYLERKNSSLVWMVNDLIRKSAHPLSGFYLYDHKKLLETLLKNESTGQQTLLIGVTYALLDFFEQHPVQLQHTIVMETGGMKGRKSELPRLTVHDIIKAQTGLLNIHAEYGMTELLSQAYSYGDGLFACAPWMQVLLRAEDDPLYIVTAKDIKGSGKNGAVNIIDLSNIFSCAFLATDDAGILYPDGKFEIIGRLDNSDLRGCSLMLV